MLRAQTANIAAPPVDEVESLPDESLWQSVRGIFCEEAPWWGGSFAFHVLLLSAVALLAGAIPARQFASEVQFTVAPAPLEDAVPDIDANPVAIPPDFKPPDTQPTKVVSPDADDTATDDDHDTTGSESGLKNAIAAASADRTRDVGSSFWLPGSGPGHIGPNHETTPGTSGSPGPYGGRGKGGIPRIETRVAAALQWLARHQSSDGSWSLQGYAAQCRDKTCSGPGAAQADSAATALAILPYLAANHTHRSKGKYQKTVANGLAWLVRRQKPDGDLRCGATMYAHGLATIALCEACGMTGDRSVGHAAQRAVDFLQAAQNKRTGGWRYQPGDEGDLSVTGWQIMALKSAQMAGLSVDAGAFQRGREYVAATSAGQGDSASSSAGRGLFAYQPGAAPNNAMTAVGLLCSQYLGMARNDPAMTGGTARLMANLPDAAQRDLYFWYYAAQVMHNQPGADWDVYDRRLRNLLVVSQDRQGCAAGSWDPQRPSPDPWGSQGGRLMMTCLAALTLEVDYRFMPLYQLDKEH